MEISRAVHETSARLVIEEWATVDAPLPFIKSTLHLSFADAVAAARDCITLRRTYARTGPWRCEILVPDGTAAGRYHLHENGDIFTGTCNSSERPITVTEATRNYIGTVRDTASTPTADLTDPAAHADALGLTFSQSQAGWLNHHIRGALVGAMGTAFPVAVTARLVAICDAVADRVEE